jgi:hypothetical protein
MAFCTNCQTIINTLFTKSRYQRLSADTLVEHFLFRSKYHDIFSITTECRLCAFVREGLPTEDVVRQSSASWPADSLSMWVQAKGGNAFRRASTDSGLRLWQLEVLMVFEAQPVAERFNLRISVTALKGTRSPYLAPQDSELVLGSPAAKAGDVFGTNPLLNFPVSDTLSILSSWLDECVSGHERCGGHNDPAVIDTTKPDLPTRVLDISPSYEESAIRLIESRGLRAHYVALSHCWGPPEKRPLSTTKATLHQHLAGIQLSQLPKTFQDAVCIARSVNLRYLWIDSLCIVQDDFEDWTREAPQMGQLYNQAYLVIAASGSRDSSEGCFLPRIAPESSIDIPYVRDDGVSDGYVQLSTKRYTVPMLPNREPLGERGWVVQEWALACRLVHFTAKGMMWYCRALDYHVMCEDGHMLAATRSYNWDDIIDEYTLRKLTYMSDKLAAVEGIARMMQQGRKDQYVSGFWTGEMPQQLFWVASRTTRPTELQCFPTWSWASTQGPCVMLVPKRVPWSKITIRCEAEIKNTSTLIINCQATKTVIKKASLSLREATQAPLFSGIIGNNSIPSLQYLLIGGIAHHLLDHDTRRVVGLVVLDDNEQLEDEYYVCTSLLLMKEICSAPKLGEVPILLALLVREARTPPKAYQRIGVAFIIDEQVFGSNDKDHFTIV